VVPPVPPVEPPVIPPVPPVEPPVIPPVSPAEPPIVIPVVLGSSSNRDDSQTVFVHRVITEDVDVVYDIDYVDEPRTITRRIQYEVASPSTIEYEVDSHSVTTVTEARPSVAQASAPSAVSPRAVAPSTLVAPAPAAASVPVPMPGIPASLASTPRIVLPGIVSAGLPVLPQVGRLPSTGGPPLPLEILFPAFLVGAGLFLRRRGQR
jgi:hypothetical protein